MQQKSLHIRHMIWSFNKRKALVQVCHQDLGYLAKLLKKHILSPAQYNLPYHISDHWILHQANQPAVVHHI